MAFPRSEFIEAYGDEASSALRHIQPYLPALAEKFSADFYEALTRTPQVDAVFRRLSDAEFSQLRRSQAEYLTLLLDPELTESAHSTKAGRVGQIHALVGVDILWLIEVFDLYEQEIHQLLSPCGFSPQERERIKGIVGRRILLDLREQVACYRRIDEQAAGVMNRIDQHAMTAANLPDLVRGVMAALGSLEGNLSAFFARVDANHEMQIEASWGSAAERYRKAMEDGAIPKISIDPDQASGRGPGGLAWRNREIVVSDAWSLDDNAAPWQAVGRTLGFRSSAAVPLVDASGHSMALLSLYSSWPGCFSTARMRNLLEHVKQVLSHAIQRRVQAPVIPLREQDHYRLLLEQRRVVMLYQPIINLVTGQLDKVEALARLQDSAGALIVPARFLPALGETELLELFAQGLEQACSGYQMLERHGLQARIAINFPAEGIGDPRYEQALFQALGSGDISPDRLQLEMLETQDRMPDPDRDQAFLSRLRDAGIQIVQDDLGSGHSSLLRMDQYAFDAVKIDQGLVRSALHKPHRALEFILYLTRLAHAFKTPVTVEGLENHGMIEAAAILGADYGQGYGIARPMPLTELPDWYNRYAHPVDSQNPKTALGALSGYLLWDLQLMAIAGRPDLVQAVAGTNSLVSQFIAARNLQGSHLHAMVQHNHSLACQELNSDAYQITRSGVIKMLTDYWLLEVQPP